MTDREFFALSLEHVTRRVRVRTGGDATEFAQLVLARIDMGADQYGDHTYLGRDNLAEASDEYADGVSYPLFELQKLRARDEPIPTEAAQLLADAMCLCAEAHLKVTQARQLLQPSP